MKLTADTITDEQIRELRDSQSPVTGNCAYLCDIACSARPTGRDPDGTIVTRERARARCAEIWNARQGGAK